MSLHPPQPRSVRRRHRNGYERQPGPLNAGHPFGYGWLQYRPVRHQHGLLLPHHQSGQRRVRRRRSESKQRGSAHPVGLPGREQEPGLEVRSHRHRRVQHSQRFQRERQPRVECGQRITANNSPVQQAAANQAKYQQWNPVLLASGYYDSWIPTAGSALPYLAVLRRKDFNCRYQPAPARPPVVRSGIAIDQHHGRRVV